MKKIMKNGGMKAMGAEKETPYQNGYVTT
jgi:hypothetical protein